MKSESVFYSEMFFLVPKAPQHFNKKIIEIKFPLPLHGEVGDIYLLLRWPYQLNHPNVHGFWLVLTEDWMVYRHRGYCSNSRIWLVEEQCVNGPIVCLVVVYVMLSFEDLVHVVQLHKEIENIDNLYLRPKLPSTAINFTTQ